MKTIYLLLLLVCFGQAKSQDFQRVLDSLDKIVSEPECSDSLKAKLLYNMAWYSRGLHKSIDQVGSYANQSLHLAMDLKLDTIVFHSSKLMGIEYSNKSQYDSAFSTVNKGITYFDQKPEPTASLNVALLHLIAANALMHATKQNESLLFYKRARKLFELSKDTTGYILLGNGLGQLYTSLGLHDEALKELYNAITLAEEGFPSELASLYNSLAMTYGKTGNVEEAKNGFQDCIIWARKMNNRQSLANAYNNLAIRLAEHAPDSAFKYYQMAIDVFQELQQPTGEKSVVLNICELHLKLEHYETVRNKLGAMNSIPNVLEAQFFYCQAQLASSDRLYSKSLEFAKDGLKCNYLDLNNEKGLYLLIYELNKDHIGDLSAAMAAYERYNDLVQQDWDAEKLLATQKVLVEYEMNKRVEANSTANNDLALTNESGQHQEKLWIWIVLIALGLVLLVWVLWKKLFNRSVSGKVVVKQASKVREQEVIRLQLETSKNATFLDTLKKELQRISDLPVDSIIPQINSVLSSVDQYTRGDQERKDFQEKTKYIGDDFFTELSKNANLTPTELKLAALLKLELSSKEIAVIMNISEKSVESYRSKLRKKLEIDKNTSLTQYFNRG